MNIFIIPSVYPNEQNQNSGIYIHKLNVALEKYGHNIVVLNSISNNYRAWFNIDRYREEQYKLDEVIVYKNGFRGFKSTTFPKYNSRKYLKNVKRLLKTAITNHGKPDLIISHFSFYSGYSAAIIAKELSIPFIVIEHHSLFLKQDINEDIVEMLRVSVKESKVFICVSDYLRQSIYEKIGMHKNIKVLPNMIDDLFKYIEPNKRNPYTFFSAGNLVESKNFENLIIAFCNTFNHDDEAILRVAGEGKLKRKLQNLIYKNGRQHQIKLLGNLNKYEMLKNYGECHCFVLPSKYETFGIVYKEALAVGRPVISSRNGGVLEDWNDKYGMLLKENDLINLEGALRYMRNHSHEFDGLEISRMILNRYSKEKIIPSLNNMLEVLNEKEVKL